MKKLILIILVVIFNAHSEHKWYLDAGAEGIGIGYELKYNSLLFHIGNCNDIWYTKNTSSLWMQSDSNALCKESILHLTLKPYLGVGYNLKLTNNLYLISYFDYLQYHMFEFGNQAIISYGKDIGPGLYIDYDALSWDLLRIEIGLINYKWKIPIGIILDIGYVLDFFKYMNISPKIIFYL